MGRFFTSIYVLARYCPRIPVQKNCTPPINNMIHTWDAQPDTGSPKISFLTITKIIMIKASAQNRTPITDAKSSGTVENARIPSTE